LLSVKELKKWIVREDGFLSNTNKKRTSKAVKIIEYLPIENNTEIKLKFLKGIIYNQGCELFKEDRNCFVSKYLMLSKPELFYKLTEMELIKH
jgi:hypothetical protein